MPDQGTQLSQPPQERETSIGGGRFVPAAGSEAFRGAYLTISNVQRKSQESLSCPNQHLSLITRAKEDWS